MKLIINGRNIALTEAIKAYVQEKLERLDHHYDFVQEVRIFLGVDKNPRVAKPQHAEATVIVNGGTIRFEASSETLYASIDLLADKMERGLSKYKSKLLLRSKSSRSSGGESIRHVGSLEDTPELDPDSLEDDDLYAWEESDPLASEDSDDSHADSHEVIITPPSQRTAARSEV